MTPERILSRIATECSKREHTEYDIRKKLTSWKVDPKAVDFVVAKLVEGNFINHKRYAYAFAHDKFLISAWGRVKIAFALKQKSIDDKIIDEAISQIGEKEYLDRLRSILEPKMPNLDALAPAKRRIRLLKLSLSHGFEPVIANDIVDEVIRNYQAGNAAAAQEGNT